MLGRSQEKILMQILEDNRFDTMFEEAVEIGSERDTFILGRCADQNENSFNKVAARKYQAFGKMILMMKSLALFILTL